MKKLCRKCNQSLDFDMFYKTKHKPLGITPYCKICTSTQARERQKLLKIECVKYKGGKCKLCGYCKSNNALEFHHTDPTKKDLNISRFKKTTLDEFLLKELDKCVLLCANCHRETHAEQKEIVLDNSIPNNIVVVHKTKIVEITRIRKKSEWNSKARPKTRKVERPPYEQLLQELKETNYLQVGKKYGVTDNAVRKWVKMYEKY